MKITKTICSDSATFIEKKTVENRLWAKCEFSLFLWSKNKCIIFICNQEHSWLARSCQHKAKLGAAEKRLHDNAADNESSLSAAAADAAAVVCSIPSRWAAAAAGGGRRPALRSEVSGGLLPPGQDSNCSCTRWPSAASCAAPRCGA